MLVVAEKDLETLQEKNRGSLQSLFNRVKGKYTDALAVPADSEVYRDTKVYVPQLMAQYDDNFLAYIEPAFVQDLAANKEWYGAIRWIRSPTFPAMANTPWALSKTVGTV